MLAFGGSGGRTHRCRQIEATRRRRRARMMAAILAGPLLATCLPLITVMQRRMRSTQWGCCAAPSRRRGPKTAQRSAHARGPFNQGTAAGVTRGNPLPPPQPQPLIYCRSLCPFVRTRAHLNKQTSQVDPCSCPYAHDCERRRNVVPCALLPPTPTPSSCCCYTRLP